MRLPHLLLVALSAGCVTWLPEVEQPCERWPEPGLYKFEVETTDKDRTPWVYVPRSAGPRDLVVMLHGAGQNGKQATESTHLMRQADRHGFVAVFPNGLGWPARFWNAGDCCGSAREARKDRADVEFLEDLVDQLSPRVCGDRVLATGFSNGGMMAHRWACEGERVDALVPVAGPLMTQECAGEPVPILHVHGTADTVVPARGGRPRSSVDASYPSVEASMRVWRERNQCTDAPPEVTRYGRATNCQRWDCAVTTELCLIEGWHHAWPGGRNTAADVDLTRYLYSWFEEHAPRDQAGAIEHSEVHGREATEGLRE